MIVLLCGGTWWSLNKWQVMQGSEMKLAADNIAPDPARYEVLAGDLGRWRQNFQDRWAGARTKEQKDAVVGDAKILLELVIPEMLRCWIGTRYDFDGTADKPGDGKLACGYYVSTVLRDAGFKVNRYELAQQASENILRTFIARNDCHLRIGMDFLQYINLLESQADGVYLVGLDSHVGFLVKNNCGSIFYHSSAWKDRGVVGEKSATAGALEYSNWRILGGLTTSSDAVSHWIEGKVFQVKK